MRWFQCGMVCLMLAQCVPGQNQLTPEQQKVVESAMDGKLVSSGKLDCNTFKFNPFLDFALQFEAGFVVSCKLRQFEGVATGMAIYIRVVPEAGATAVFGDRLNLPAIPEQKRNSIQWKRFEPAMEFSGAVALGEGRYRFEVLLVDEKNRVHRKSWNVKVSPHGKEKSVEASLRPNTVRSITVAPWERNKRAAEQGRRLTVLLDAAPIFPFSLKLRAWDRSFLLGALSSLLRQSGASQVRVIAFNLDQQREIFREDAFDKEAFIRLNGALQALELGTVSYRALQRTNGWADLLVKLVNSEVTDANPSDAVVFVGPNSRILDKIAPEAVPERADLGPRLYYFEYFPRLGYEFPDVIHRLTEACRGTVFKLRSPADFAASIAKLQRRLDSDTVSP